MKQILLAVLLFGLTTTSSAQVFRFGVKAGPNFSNFTGGDSDLDYSSRTSVHIGAVAELGLSGKLAVAPEVLYSSQGAEVDGLGDFNLDYVSVPVMAKFYILSDKISLDVGPQFSFLVSEAEETLENESFEFAMAGGVTLNLTKKIFAQARYTAGLTEASKSAEVRNTVVQFSIGYMFL